MDQLDHSVRGVLVLDKARGRSSAQAADDVRRVFVMNGMEVRAGHGGTLDPFATGVLAVCIGEGTKIASYLLTDDKAYEAVVQFGVATDTYDRTGEVLETREVTFDRAALEAAVAARRGEQDQTPPMHSAIKQGGVRLYHLARRGEEVHRPARRVRIDRLDVTAWDPATSRATLAVACSKGTYIRSLVADLGADLGSGAHLAELRRTRSGSLVIEAAMTIEAVRAATREELRAALVPLAGLTGLPSVTFAPELADQVQNGVQLPATTFTAEALPRFQLIDERGVLNAIVHVREEDGRVVYDRVFRP